MRALCRKFLRKKSKGVAAVEFALILPIFLTILFAVMDFGWMFFNQLIVTSSARAGARAGALEETDANAPNVAQTASNDFITQNGLDTSGVSVNATVQGSATPKTITVNVVMDFDPLVGILFLPSNIQPYPAQLTATAVMAREQ